MRMDFKLDEVSHVVERVERLGRSHHVRDLLALVPARLDVAVEVRQRQRQGQEDKNQVLCSHTHTHTEVHKEGRMRERTSQAGRRSQ